MPPFGIFTAAAMEAGSPDRALDHFRSGRCGPGGIPDVPDGFKIRLVAAVPAVQFRARSRPPPTARCSWLKIRWTRSDRRDKPIDRILLFRDGKDPVVFADKLNAIFGMVWHDGALYVMHMPHLTVIRDTDGDGKADERKELFTDMGSGGSPNNFNDHIVSGIKFGIDGYLYIAVGDKGVPRATGRDGRTAQVNGGGIFAAGSTAQGSRSSPPARGITSSPTSMTATTCSPTTTPTTDWDGGPGSPTISTAAITVIPTTTTTGGPDAAPDGRVRRRLALRRRILQGRRLAREVPRPRLLGRMGQEEVHAFRFEPDGFDIQGR